MKPTPVLDSFYRKGFNVFLYFDELAAMAINGGTIPEAITTEIRENKETLIVEIRSVTAQGEKVSFDNFIEDRLSPDGTQRPALGWQKSHRSSGA